MVGHSDTNNSSGMTGQVLTTRRWSAARKRAMESFTPSEHWPEMARSDRPHRNIVVGKRLQLARIAFGMANKGQGKFAEAADIRPNTYNMWERGENFPGLENALKLCEAHPGLSLDWIYLGKMEGLPTWLSGIITSLLRAEAERSKTQPPDTQLGLDDTAALPEAKIVTVDERRRA